MHRSHAPEELIGKMLRRLNPWPGEQLIVTLVGCHDNCHACGQHEGNKSQHILKVTGCIHASGKSKVYFLFDHQIIYGLPLMLLRQHLEIILEASLSLFVCLYAITLKLISTFISCTNSLCLVFHVSPQ